MNFRSDDAPAYILSFIKQKPPSSQCESGLWLVERLTFTGCFTNHSPSVLYLPSQEGKLFNFAIQYCCYSKSALLFSTTPEQDLLFTLESTFPLLVGGGEKGVVTLTPKKHLHHHTVSPVYDSPSCCLLPFRRLP
jgi:hypothetical protein